MLFNRALYGTLSAAEPPSEYLTHTPHEGLLVAEFRPLIKCLLPDTRPLGNLLHGHVPHRLLLKKRVDS